MVSEDRRAYLRIDTPNLLSFFCCDENNNQIVQGMGRTINIGEGGIFFETHVPIDTQLNISLSLALEDDLMDFKGEIIHSRKNDKGRYIFGIKFLEMNDLKQRFLKQYLLILNGHEEANFKMIKDL